MVWALFELRCELSRSARKAAITLAGALVLPERGYTAPPVELERTEPFVPFD